MAWPITLNGNTYTEAEIVGPDYDQVLGRFLYDLSRQISLTKTPVGESNSTILPGTGNRNFVLSKGSELAFPVGGMVTAVGYTANGKPKYLLTGEVLTPLGGGGVLRVQVDHQFQFPDSEVTSAVRWELVSGTWVVPPAPEEPMDPPPEEELRIIEDFDVPYSYGVHRNSATAPDPFPVGIYSTGNYVLRPSQDLHVRGRPGVVRLSPGEAGAAAMMMDRVDVHYARKGSVTFGFRVTGTGSGHLSVGLRARVPSVDDGTPANLLQSIGPPHGPALRTRINPGGASDSERTESVFTLQYLGTEPGVHLFSAGDWLTFELNTDGFPEEFIYGRLTNHSSGVNTPISFGDGWPSGMAPYLVPYLTLWRYVGEALHLEVDYIEVRQSRDIGEVIGPGGPIGS